MTHRDRVLNAIKHKNADRIPIDFWAEQPTLEKLYSFYGTRILDKILDDFDVDMRHVETIMPPEKYYGDFYQNFWGERYIYRETKWGPMREDIPGALSSAKNIENLEDYDWPNPDDFDYTKLKSTCDKYDGYALMYGFADIWQRPCLVRGLENLE